MRSHYGQRTIGEISMIDILLAFGALAVALPFALFWWICGEGE